MKSSEKILIFICALCLAIFILVTAIISTVKAIRRIDYDIVQQEEFNSKLGKEFLAKSGNSTSSSIDSIVSSYIKELNSLGLSVENYNIKRGNKPTAEFKFSCDEEHFLSFITEFPNMQSSRCISSISVSSEKNMCVVKSTVERNYGRMHESELFYEIPGELIFLHDASKVKQNITELKMEAKKTEYEKHVSECNYSVLGYVNGSCYVKDKDGKISLLSEF